nr:MAG TPA: hypothetical protein [Microviridae sp.]
MHVFLLCLRSRSLRKLRSSSLRQIETHTRRPLKKTSALGALVLNQKGNSGSGFGGC